MGSDTACCRPRRRATLARSGASIRRLDFAIGGPSRSVTNDTDVGAGRFLVIAPANSMCRAPQKAMVRTKAAADDHQKG